jgi:hypothetical protein
MIGRNRVAQGFKRFVDYKKVIIKAGDGGDGAVAFFRSSSSFGPTDEWAKLKEWNQKTNSRIHDADLPKTSTGKYFVIIPHADYNDKTISFFKTIGVKGHLYDNESKLEVKDEDDLSGSSSSESGSPDKEKKM